MIKPLGICRLYFVDRLPVSIHIVHSTCASDSQNACSHATSEYKKDVYLGNAAYSTGTCEQWLLHIHNDMNQRLIKSKNVDGKIDEDAYLGQQCKSSCHRVTTE